MTTPAVAAPASERVPQRLWEIRITPGLAGVWTILGLGLLVGATLGVSWLEVALHPDWRSTSPVLAVLSVLAALPVTYVAHEGVHGLVFRVFGGRPRYGGGFASGIPYFYAACPGQRFARDRFLLVGLAPLVLLDLAGLALMLAAPAAVFGAALVVFNTSGAIGDLWAAGVLLQAPRWVEIEDDGPSFIAWAPAERTAPRLPLGLDFPAGRWVLPWFLTTLVLYVIGSGILGAAVRASHHAVGLGPLELATPHRLDLGALLLVAALIAAAIVASVAFIRKRLA